MAVDHSTDKRKADYSVIVSIVVIAIGIASFRTSATGMFTYGADLGTRFSYSLSLLVQVATVIVLMALSNRLLQSKRVLVFIFWIALGVVLIGTSLVLFSEYSNGDASPLIYDIGVVMSGAGSAPVLLGWGAGFCSLNPRYSAMAICLGFCIYSIFSCLFSVLPRVFTICSAFVFPVIATSLLLYYYKRGQDFKLYATKTAKVSVAKLPVGIIVLMVLCYLASNVLSTIVSGLTTPTTVFLQPVVFGITLVIFYVWIYRLKRNDPESLWPMFVLALIGCLLLYLTSWQSDNGMMVSMMTAMKQWNMMFYWILLAVLIYRLELPPVIFFGLGNLIIGSLGRLIVELGSSLVDGAETTVSTAFFTSAIAIFAFLIIVVAFYALNSKRSHLLPENLAVEKPDVDNALNRLAQRYGLSKRESEIAGYMIRGYTFRQMSEEIFISIDTVRSHSKNLYRKLGIHKRQELYQLVEQDMGAYLSDTR